MKKLILLLSLFLTFSFANIYSSDLRTIDVFDKSMIHFNPDSSTKYETDIVQSTDNGREINSIITLPEYDSAVKIIGHLEIHPIPKDYLSVNDPWDRAGNIRLSIEGMADVELIKFVTSYGGFTEYDVDLSHLQSILKGEVTIKGFIDSWVSPGWKVDFSLTYETVADSVIPKYSKGIAFIESYNKQDTDELGYDIEVIIPGGMNKVLLYYLVSGHCTDGRDEDEFISKDNVIRVDGQVVYRYQPWRDDCRQFRAINPYTKRWSDGYWSSDYSRSGWCPGDIVKPLVLDLTDHLTPGKHYININIENIRPVDENNHFGYWRVSSYLVGWDRTDIYKYNE